MADSAQSLLSAEAVAARLGLSRTAIYALCESGELQHYRLGVGKKKRFRISEADLEAYLEQSRAKVPHALRTPQQRQRRNVRYAGYSHLRAGGYQG